jgi:drug/metabolite transporter (DMT)-like permease
MMITGMILGLAAAACQTLCYLAARLFLVHSKKGEMQLLTVAHLWMAVMSAIALPFFWPATRIDPRLYLIPTLGATGFYLCGQALLFVALRRAEASRISPLLTIKISITAIITVLLGATLGWDQWAAIALAVAAAVVLSGAGGKLGTGTLLAVLLTCVSYSASDIHIRWLLRDLREVVSNTQAIGLSVCFCYLVAGVVAMIAWPFTARTVSAKQWVFALPFATSWLVAMACFFGSISMIGVVYASILQPTRGLMSVLMGVLIAYLGHHHIEQPHRAAIIIRRVIAAIGMTLAVILFAK